MNKDRHTNRKAHNRIELVGKRFGKLTVTEDTGRRRSRRPIWKCVCDCGSSIEVNGKYLLAGDTKSCGCFSKGNAHNRDAVAEITRSFWTPIQKQAVRRGIPFEISREQAWAQFQAQEGRCALSGVPLKFSSNIRDERGTQTASLDRRNNSKGYVKGNVQWVHKKVNILKNVLPEDELLLWCARILNYRYPSIRGV